MMRFVIEVVLIVIESVEYFGAGALIALHD